MTIRTLRDVDPSELAGLPVLLRVDLNVPMLDGVISDDTRIRAAVATIEWLSKAGAAIIIASHFGRPRGIRTESLSLRPLSHRLSKILGKPVAFAEDCIGDKVREQALALGPGECLLLENLRFHPGETANDLAFARQLSRLCRLYVNDAFSCAHRAHASIAAITDYGPSCAGLALMQELDALGKALEAPERPLVSIAGGAKISTKIAMLDHLLDRSDYLVVGGGLANTLLFARGYGIGRSLYEASLFQEAVRILKKAEQSHCKLILPEDLVVAENPGAAEADQIVDVKAIPDDMMALDLGPKSRSRIADLITQSRTMLWNGPLGLFERAPFAGATLELARMSRDQTAKGCLKVVAGGGDTLAALKAACIRHDEFHHVSTAGGAFLHWLEGKPMPGLLPLEMAEQGK